MYYQRLNRATDALRTVSIQANFLPHTDGSVLISCGNTKVICTATIDENIPAFLRGKNQGWVTAEYGMLPASTQSRMKREAASGKQSGRTQEIQRLIGRSLRACVDMKKLGERQILIDCDVIQADGGTRTTSITGAFVALKLAIQKMLNDGRLPETPLIGSVAAISVGVVNGIPLLDLDYPEDSGCDSDINLVMLNAEKIIEIQGTAEGAAFDIHELNTLIQLAQKGIRQLSEWQEQAFQSV